MTENLDQLLNNLGSLEPEVINNIAEEAGRAFKDSVKMNQIRNIYSQITKIRLDYKQHYGKKEDKEKTIKRSLVMLKPKLAYAAGRKKELKDFQRFFDKAIDEVVNSDDFEGALQNFFFLAEAVVAYHKYYGGKDN
jgi:CRISPR-associated protein Csm2